MNPQTRAAAIQSIFNAANIGGIGAIALSLGVGSAAGSAVFAGAVVVGTYSKYKSLTAPPPETFLGKIMQDPTVTAKILMAAAAWNCGDAVVDLFAQGPDARFQNACRAVAWLFGVMGDNALRRLDHVNFRDILVSKKKTVSRLRASCAAAGANPPLFYNAAGVALTGALLAGEVSPLKAACSLAVAGLYAAGIVHAMRRCWLAAAGRIGPEEINDGLLNRLSASANMAQSLFAAVTGQWWVAGAQALFSVCSLKALHETRAALAKSASAP